MEFFADWHTHSQYSDGRGTVEENIQAAAARGLEQLAITDHGPRNIWAGVSKPEAFLAIKEEAVRINESYPQVKVLSGIEADIVGLDGAIDIPHRVAAQLDVLIVGLHPYVWPTSAAGAWGFVAANQAAKLSKKLKCRVRVDNTKALKEAVSSYRVDFISHPDLQMPVDVAELADFCAARGTALEINTGHHYDKTALIETAIRTGVDLVVNSDAHFPDTVGDLAAGAELLEHMQVPAERVRNARVPH